jgi:hypothetical protein
LKISETTAPIADREAYREGLPPVRRQAKLRATVEVIHKEEDRSLSTSSIADLVEFEASTSQISRLIQKAEDRNLLIVDRKKGKPNIYEVSSLGEKFIEQDPPYEETAGRSEAGEVRVHYVRGELEIQNIDDLDERWKADAARQEQVPHYKDGGPFEIRYRVTGDKLILFIGEDIRGYNVWDLKSEVIYEFLKCVEYLKEFTPYRFEDRRCVKIRTATQHIALVRNPFAEFVDEHSEVALSDVRIVDEDGELRFWLDKSGGTPELEAGWGNNPGGLKNWSEADIFFIKLYVYEVLISNKESWKKFLTFLKEADLDQLIEDYTS